MAYTNGIYYLDLEAGSDAARPALTSVSFGSSGTGGMPPGSVFYSLASQPPGTVISGNTVFTAGGCRLTSASPGGQAGSLIFPTSVTTSSFAVEFDLTIYNGSGADGAAFTFGDFSNNSGSELGLGGANNLAICFDTYTTFTSPNNYINWTAGGVTTQIGTTNTLNMRGTIARHIIITVDALDRISVNVNGTFIFLNAQLPASYSSANKSSWRMGFSARTGGLTDDHFIYNYRYASGPYTFIPVRCTKAGHGLVTGAIVDASGTTSYNEAWKVSVVDLNTFDLVDSSYTTTQTGTVTPRGGSSWADAFLTPATAGGYAVNYDEIRVAKSPVTQVSSSATWTADSTSLSITTASPLTTLINDATVAWTSASAGYSLSRLSVSLGSTVNGPTGGFAVYATSSSTSPPSNSKVAYFTLPSTLNLAAFDRLSFWVRGEGQAISDSRWIVKLCSDSLGNTPVSEFAITSVTLYGAMWQPKTLARTGGGNLGNGINSIAIYTGALPPGTPWYLYLAQFHACTAGGLSLSSLIGRSPEATAGAEAYYQISRIEAATGSAGNYTTNLLINKYGGATGAGSAYIVTPSLPAYHFPGDANFLVKSALISYVGGWNKTSNIVDGETFVTSHQLGLFAGPFAGTTSGAHVRNVSPVNTYKVILGSLNYRTYPPIYLSGHQISGGSDFTDLVYSSSIPYSLALEYRHIHTSYGISVGNSYYTGTYNVMHRPTTIKGTYFYNVTQPAFMYSGASLRLTNCVFDGTNTSQYAVYHQASITEYRATHVPSLIMTGCTFRRYTTLEISLQVYTLPEAFRTYHPIIARDCTFLSTNTVNVPMFSHNDDGTEYHYIYNGNLGLVYSSGGAPDTRLSRYTANTMGTTRPGGTGVMWRTVLTSVFTMLPEMSITKQRDVSFFGMPDTISVAKIPVRCNGETVTVSAWMKKDSATSMQAGIYIMDGSLPTIPDVIYTALADNVDWQQISLSFTLPANGRYEVVEVRQFAYTSVLSNAIAYVDSIDIVVEPP